MKAVSEHGLPTPLVVYFRDLRLFGVAAAASSAHGPLP
jgi:hypothetical protein